MGKYDFDKVIDRHGSGAIKVDCLEERYGRPDLIAAWVADMDFATPSFIIDALKERLEHPILGYTAEPADYRPAIMDWERNLHGWELDPEWLSYIPGIVKGIGMVLNVFTKPGEDVVIMPPVYHPFRIVPEENGRNVVNVPMIEDEDHRYHVDFEAFENLDTKGGVLIFSNPHNPSGRMWSKEELQKVAEISKKKNLLVISDEIHADMALWGNRHVPFATVSEEAAQNSITFCAPSKTFNIPGLVSSWMVVKDPELRKGFYHWLEVNEFNAPVLVSAIGAEAAYSHGEEWLDEMLAYVQDNIDFVGDYVSCNIPNVKVVKPEASFLVWLDFTALGLEQKELMDLLLNEAHVALNDGSMFGRQGVGFMRLNVGTPRSVLKDALDHIAAAVETIVKA